jgi:uncharacterized linocin/CFP29 family protein
VDPLSRDGAPLPDGIWREIADAAVDAARDMLTARRFLELEGPFGAGLTTIELGNDDYCRTPGEGEAGAVLGRALSVPMLRKSFRLSIRRVAAHLQYGQPLDLSPVEDAAEAVAAREEEFVYYGQPDFGLQGLLTAEGRSAATGGDWSDVDQALNDVLAAVTRLDEAGFRGPYALALEPALYNGLFRRYPGTDMLQLEHLKRLCTKGIYKAPIQGGAVVDPRVGKIILGQDLAAAYAAQDGIHYQLYLSESLVFRLDEPRAVCTIATAGTNPAAKRS